METPKPTQSELIGDSLQAMSDMLATESVSAGEKGYTTIEQSMTALKAEMDKLWQDSKAGNVNDSNLEKEYKGLEARYNVLITSR